MNRLLKVEKYTTFSMLTAVQLMRTLGEGYAVISYLSIIDIIGNYYVFEQIKKKRIFSSRFKNLLRDTQKSKLMFRTHHAHLWKKNGGTERLEKLEAGQYNTKYILNQESDTIPV